jgi:hypothetical protein
MSASHTEPTILRWLRAKQVAGLPDQVVLGPSYYHRDVVHHPRGCIYTIEDPNTAVYGAPDEEFLCGCVVADSCAGTTDKEFFRVLRQLVFAESCLIRALDPSTYDKRRSFTSFVSLALRHHRWYAAATSAYPDLLGPAPLRAAGAELERIRQDLVQRWDAAEADHPLDEATIRADAIRWAVRDLVSGELLPELAHIGLPAFNACSQLVYQWLSKPVERDLLEEFYTEAGDALRDAMRRPESRGFSLRLLDRFTTRVKCLSDRDELVACHIGSPTADPFETSHGPRSLLVFHGLRARGDSMAFGEYPDVVVEWLTRPNPAAFRAIVTTTAPGGAVVPICESVLTEQHQWEIALALWNDSFVGVGSRDTEDPGPYRDQRTAILAAASL